MKKRLILSRVALITVLALGLLWTIQGSLPAYADPPDPNNGNEEGIVGDPPIVVDGGWSTFYWSGAGPVFNSDGPFTFTSSTPVVVKVTDDFCKGDQFMIYDFGVPIGVTSPPAPPVCLPGVGPDAAYADPTYSSGAFPLPPGPHSITIQVIANPWNAGAGYIRVDSETAITLASFSAEAGDEGVTLAWETGTEVDNAGFNLHRALTQDGPWNKINGALIAAEGDPVAGASYSFLDKPDYGTFYYQLEDVDLYGVSTLHGPVKATVARPLRRPLYRPTLPEF
jgi:hypothetical protein